MVTSENNLIFDLFHGTSTLFLDSIIQYGLGGVDPVANWKLVELSTEVYDLSEQYLQHTDLFQSKGSTFKKMSRQAIHGNFNYQHGDSYLTADEYNACRHASKMRYGSEILTYTIEFVNELLRFKDKFDYLDLFKRNPKLVDALKTNPSPILIQASNVSVSSLLSDNGMDPQSTLDRVKDPNSLKTFSQITNFRLISPIKFDKLKFWLVNVQSWDNSNPQYNLYQINPERAE